MSVLAPLVLSSLLGFASPVGLSSWDVPLACPSAAWVEDRVSAYLRRPLAQIEVGFGFDGHVLETPGGELELVLEVRLAGVGEHHSLRKDDCRALAEAAAALIAITIDPLAMLGPSPPPADTSRGLVPVQRPSPPQPDSVPARPAVDRDPELETPARVVEAPPARGPEAQPSSEDRSVPERELRMLVRAEGGVVVGLFESVAPTIHAGLGLDTRRLGARLGFAVTLAGGVALAGRFRDAEGSRGGDLLAWELRARPCLVPRWGIVDLRVCAALGAGQIRGRGVGVSEPQLGTQAWLSALAELELALALHSRVALIVDLGGGLNLLRPVFELADPALRYVVPPATGRARLGLELRFF